MSIELTEQWLAKANDDYISAMVLMDKIIPPQIEIACFHCQQCAEKALKAFCEYNGIEIQKTHNLIVLCQSCISVDSRFDSVLSECARLTAYSVQTRYPNCIDILEEEARDALIQSKRIYDFVEKTIRELELTSNEQETTTDEQ